MVNAVAHGHPPPPVGDVLKVQAKDLTGTQSALQHEQDQRAISHSAQRPQKSINLLLIQGTRQPTHGLDTHAPPHRALTTGVAHERLVAI